MNRYIQFTVFGVVWTIVLYGLGSFVAAGWSIRHDWDAPGRCLIAFLWLWGAGLMLAVTATSPSRRTI